MWGGLTPTQPLRLAAGPTFYGAVDIAMVFNRCLWQYMTSTGAAQLNAKNTRMHGQARRYC
jgi:hypothetical protein